MEVALKFPAERFNFQKYPSYQTDLNSSFDTFENTLFL